MRYGLAWKDCIDVLRKLGGILVVGPHPVVPGYMSWVILVLYGDGTVRMHYWNHHNEPVSLGVDHKRNSQICYTVVKETLISGILDK